MKKTVASILAIMMLVSLFLTGTSALAAEKTKITFYGLILEYPPSQAMVDRMVEKLGDKYEFEIIPVDWGNLDTVIRTGIASGNPCDIYCYWPGGMRTFVDAGQALDLTPYLEANDNAWKNTFVPAQLDVGLVDGKYYGLPLNATYQMAMVNVDIFKQAGVEVKETWTWEEFMDACAKIKAIDKFPFAIGNQGLDWIWKNILVSKTLTDGTYDAFLNYDLPKDDPALSYLLDTAKALDDNGYWYPGKGGVNTARDEARASFLKGDSAVLFEMASIYADVKKDCDFETAPVCWPSAGTPVNMGGTDGYFIPSNCKNVDAAVECLQVLLDAESEAFLPSASIIPSNAAVKVEDPTLAKLAELSGYMRSGTPASEEFNNFMKQSFVADYLLGTSSKEDLLNEYEALCQAEKAQ